MMRLSGSWLTVPLALSACQPGPGAEDPKIAELEQNIRAINARVVLLEAARRQASDEAHAPSRDGFDLVTTWPNAAPDRHAYDSRADCETARAVILIDNKRKVDEANARIGEVLPGGGIVAVARPGPLPTALCLPA